LADVIQSQSLADTLGVEFGDYLDLLANARAAVYEEGDVAAFEVDE
jgi:hypothetical protein